MCFPFISVTPVSADGVVLDYDPTLEQIPLQLVSRDAAVASRKRLLKSSANNMLVGGDYRVIKMWDAQGLVCLHRLIADFLGKFRGRRSEGFQQTLGGRWFHCRTLMGAAHVCWVRFISSIFLITLISLRIC